jgi:Tol biopolymer transport system component
MKISALAVLLLLVPTSQMCRAGNHSHADSALPKIPEGSLLVGTPPYYLLVTRSHTLVKLQPEDAQQNIISTRYIYPTISRDGKVIAYARAQTSRPALVTISTYSTITNKHTDFASGEYSGSIAISGDGSKLAFSGIRDEPNSRTGARLHIVELKTGTQREGPEISASWPVSLSWSPDSRFLAYGVSGEIRVWDSSTGKILKIADGDLPVWSPSGEWIAYFQGVWQPQVHRAVYPGRWAPRCLLVHPDGSGAKTVVDLSQNQGRQRSFVEPPVWSPDSSQILLNELADIETGSVTIHMLNLETLKLRTLFKNSVRVFGWAEDQ